MIKLSHITELKTFDYMCNNMIVELKSFYSLYIWTIAFVAPLEPLEISFHEFFNFF
jgi:hypothetical protein